MLHTKKIHLRERPLKKLLTTETQNIFKNSLAYSIGFFFFKYISVKEGRNLQGKKNEFRWKGSRMKKKKSQRQLKPTWKVIKTTIFTEENRIRAVIRCDVYFKVTRRKFECGGYGLFAFEFKLGLGQRWALNNCLLVKQLFQSSLVKGGIK